MDLKALEDGISLKNKRKWDKDPEEKVEEEPIPEEPKEDMSLPLTQILLQR